MTTQNAPASRLSAHRIMTVFLVSGPDAVRAIFRQTPPTDTVKKAANDILEAGNPEKADELLAIAAEFSKRNNAFDADIHMSKTEVDESLQAVEPSASLADGVAFRKLFGLEAEGSLPAEGQGRGQSFFDKKAVQKSLAVLRKARG